MPAATSSSCCRFVRCVFLSSSSRLYNCSKSLPAKQNVIKPPPTPPPPQRASRANDGKRQRQKNAKSAKRRIAENMVSQSQEYTTQATFFELRAKSQPKKHYGIAAAKTSCFLNKAKMRHNPRGRGAQHLEECENLAQGGVFEVREKQH